MGKQKKGTENDDILSTLMKSNNPYEQVIADYVLAHANESLITTIITHNRSVGQCLSYIASIAKKKAGNAQCVMIADDEVFGLAMHFFQDGDSPIEFEAGTKVSLPRKRTVSKPKAAPVDNQLTFNFEV